MQKPNDISYSTFSFSILWLILSTISVLTSLDFIDVGINLFLFFVFVCPAVTTYSQNKELTRRLGRPVAPIKQQKDFYFGLGMAFVPFIINIPAIAFDFPMIPLIVNLLVYAFIAWGCYDFRSELKTEQTYLLKDLGATDYASVVSSPR